MEFPIHPRLEMHGCRPTDQFWSIILLNIYMKFQLFNSAIPPIIIILKCYNIQIDQNMNFKKYPKAY